MEFRRVLFRSWNNAQQRELKAVQAEFTAETDIIGELLRQRLEGYELVARGGVSLFASVDRPSAGQWQGYVDALNIAARYPDMLGLGYAPYLDRSELQELQLEMRADGPGFRSEERRVGKEWGGTWRSRGSPEHK